MRKKFSIIAFYIPTEIGSDLPNLTRHVMDVSSENDIRLLDEMENRAYDIARDTSPAGYTVNATLICPEGISGYEEMMAKVNVGTAGIPA